MFSRRRRRHRRRRRRRVCVYVCLCSRSSHMRERVYYAVVAARRTQRQQQQQHPPHSTRRRPYVHVHHILHPVHSSSLSPESMWGGVTVAMVVVLGLLKMETESFLSRMHNVKINTGRSQKAVVVVVSVGGWVPASKPASPAQPNIVAAGGKYRSTLGI